MNKIEYISPYKDQITSYLEYKKSIGKSIHCDRIFLNNFDKYTIQNKPNELTKEYLEKWLTKRENETNNTLASRATVIKNFAIYLNQHNVKAYIIDKKNYNRKQIFMPHIYTNQEIKSIFKSLNEIILSNKNFEYKKDMYNLLFEILYCCGLRISEVIKIRYCNIDLEHKLIFIEKTKNYKERNIIINQSICDKITKYKNHFNNLNEADYLFQNCKTKLNISKQNIEKDFRKIIENSDLDKTKYYRIHDFRHTFAVNNLKKVFLNKEDTNVFMPILMTYMGHQHISSTEYYLRFTADIYPEFIKEYEKYFSNVIPKIGEMKDE